MFSSQFLLWLRLSFTDSQPQSNVSRRSERHFRIKVLCYTKYPAAWCTSIESRPDVPGDPSWPGGAHEWDNLQWLLYRLLWGGHTLNLWHHAHALSGYANLIWVNFIFNLKTLLSSVSNLVSDKMTLIVYNLGKLKCDL